MDKTCAYETCDQPVLARGLCNGHYTQQRNGKPLAPLMGSMSRLERNIKHVNTDDPDGCWPWTGTITKAGYGHVSMGGRRRQLAHRWLYQELVEPIPDDLQVDHLCRNRACVNPDHLDIVTPRVNTLRGETRAAANAAKTECHRGHPFTPENTYVGPKGNRACRECKRIEKRQRQADKGLTHNRDKTHCKHGHEFTPANIIWQRDGKKRACRECDRIRQKVRRESRVVRTDYPVS